MNSINYKEKRRQKNIERSLRKMGINKNNVRYKDSKSKKIRSGLKDALCIGLFFSLFFGEGIKYIKIKKRSQVDKGKYGVIKHISSRMFISALFMIVILYICNTLNEQKGIFDALLFGMFKKDEGPGLLDIYIAQISMTFIVTTLSSILSTSSKTIYWEDIMTYKLVKPRFSGFVDITAYLFSVLIFSTVLFFSHSEYLVISFIISILLLTILTLKMIGAFFGEEYVESEIKTNFLTQKKMVEKIAANYSKLYNMNEEELSDEEVSEIDPRTPFVGELVADYYSDLDKLFAATMTAIESKEIKNIKRNIGLMLDAREYELCEICLKETYSKLPEKVLTGVILYEFPRFRDVRFRKIIENLISESLKRGDGITGMELLSYLGESWWLYTSISIYEKLSSDNTLEKLIECDSYDGLKETLAGFMTESYSLTRLLNRLKEMEQLVDLQSLPLYKRFYNTFMSYCKGESVADYYECMTLGSKSISVGKNWNEVQSLLSSLVKLREWVKNEDIKFGDGWASIINNNVKVFSRYTTLRLVIFAIMASNNAFCYNILESKSLTDKDTIDNVYTFDNLLRHISIPDKTYEEDISLVCLQRE